MSPSTTWTFIPFVLFLFFFSCNSSESFDLAIPEHFPLPKIPEDNQVTKERELLGRKLFFDKNLSLDSSISCQSCHQPARAFADFEVLSTGLSGRKGKRNAPSLLNAAYLDLINKDGGVKSLDLQALVPIEDENEMGISIVQLSMRLSEDSEYVKLSQLAYDRDPDAFVVTRALASYVRSLYSGDSDYDRYMKGDSTALNEEEKMGMNLFLSNRLNCSSCHSGFNFTNNNFENNGLYEHYEDMGRALISLDSSDIGKFRVPSLRNVAVTAPYMHDGSVNSLQNVIAHYSNLIVTERPQASKNLVEFQLTGAEKAALIAFLRSLTEAEYRH